MKRGAFRDDRDRDEVSLMLYNKQPIEVKARLLSQQQTDFSTLHWKADCTGPTQVPTKIVLGGKFLFIFDK